MTEDDLKDFLEQNKADISAKIKSTIIERMVQSMQYQLSSITADTVNAFIKDEIIPELQKHLQENKGPIVQSVIAATSVIGDEIQKTMVKQAVENLTGYRGGDVIKSIFGAR